MGCCLSRFSPPSTSSSNVEFTLRSTSTLDALLLSFKTLCASSTTLGETLKDAIEAFLDSIRHIDSEQTSANLNTQSGLVEVVERIQKLTSIVEELIKYDPDKGRVIAGNLEIELRTITKRLKTSHGGRREDHYAAVLKEWHNTMITQMIVDCAELTREIANARIDPYESHHPIIDRHCLLDLTNYIDALKAAIAARDIQGEYGNTGHHAHVGGEGGIGEAPQLDRFLNILGHVSGACGVPLHFLFSPAHWDQVEQAVQVGRESTAATAELGKVPSSSCDEGFPFIREPQPKSRGKEGDGGR
ncbi:hypothetical protein R3P38DRAFT_1343210 [Favolaschia claudopus]|uniref:Fungal N-terminal domain-containing protein n=1 Tax=Favolaschia claudopus TaxID=2862362 RepID=A0AAW0DUX4_9AGAR